MPRGCLYWQSMRTTYALGIQLPDSNPVPQRTNLFELSTPNAKTTTSAILVTPYQCWLSGAFLSACLARRWVYVAQENALQGESMRRFHLRNIADTTEIMDSLQLGPSIHPFSLPYPLPCPTSAFSRPSLIPHCYAPHSGLCKVLVVVWKANKMCGQTSGQSTSPSPQRAADPGYSLIASGAQRLADLLPYQNQAPWPRFYPAFTPL